MERQIFFTGQNKLELKTVKPDRPGDDQVLVRSEMTLISSGTEGIALHRRFDAGTHWDNWVKYPFTPGYSAVGVVEKVGKNVTTLKAGDRVVYRGRHASTNIIDATRCYPAPKNVPANEAAWFALVKIGAMIMPQTGNIFSKNVVVIGAGPIGQMAARWVNAAGPAQLIVIDPIKKRLDLIKRAMCAEVISATGDKAKEKVLALTNGQGADLVVDTTGNAAVFAQAMNLCRNFARVVLLGDPGSPASQHLTSDMIIKGLTVVAVHDWQESPTWNSALIAKLWFKLIKEGKFVMKGLTTNVFKPENAAAAYDLATVQRNGIGVAFDWR